MATDAFSLEEYLVSLGNSGRTGAQETYRYLLLPFARWIRAEKKKSVTEATAIEVEEYLATLKASTAKSSIAAIRGFFKHRYMSLPLESPDIVRETQRYNQMAGIRLKKAVKEYKAIALDPDEVQDLLTKCRERKLNKLIYAGLVLVFYFGARPIELEKHLFDAEINWDNRWMKIKTAKTGTIRYLSWHPDINPYLKTWYKYQRNCTYPGEWLTKSINSNIPDIAQVKTKSGEIVNVTAKTGRRTVESQFRMEGIPDLFIRSILGHTYRSVSDEYTDFTKLKHAIDDIMNNKHYMILSEVLT